MTSVWKADWTAAKPLTIDYDWSPVSGAVWEPFNDAGGVKRDMGLYRASAGQMRSTYFKVDGSGRAMSEEWRCHDLDFQLIYVRAGTARLVVDGAEHELAPGFMAAQPGFTWYALRDLSDDFEYFEVTAPGDYRTHWGRSSTLPARAAELVGLTPVYAPLTAESYRSGDRPIFTYRLYDTAALSENRIKAHSVQMVPPVQDGGTGFHWHPAQAWAFILGGRAHIYMEVGDGFELIEAREGDALSNSFAQVHNVARYTADYHVFEILICEEFTTINVERAVDTSGTL